MKGFGENREHRRGFRGRLNASSSGEPREYKLDRGCHVSVPVKPGPKSLTWFIVKEYEDGLARNRIVRLIAGAGHRLVCGSRRKRRGQGSDAPGVAVGNVLRNWMIGVVALALPAAVSAAEPLSAESFDLTRAHAGAQAGGLFGCRITPVSKHGPEQ